MGTDAQVLVRVTYPVRLRFQTYTPQAPFNRVSVALTMIELAVAAIKK